MIKLFHSSNKRLSVLAPTIGDNRHKGEDPRAVNAPVIYLTNSEEENFADKNGKILRYKYIVEIAVEDPDLILDEKDFSFRQECNETFGDNDETRWYFLKRSTRVQKTLKWDGNKYVKRDNF